MADCASLVRFVASLTNRQNSRAKKVVRVATGGIIERLAADGWRALERILSDVHNVGMSVSFFSPGQPNGCCRTVYLKSSMRKSAEVGATE